MDRYSCEVDWAVVLRVLKSVSSAEQLLDEVTLQGLWWAQVQELVLA